MNIEPIAFFHSPLTEKFGIPRQAGLAPSLKGEVRLVREFAREEALRGLDGFTHLWLIWGFDRNRSEVALTVRPPRLGGNTRMGVFATRSPFRPNGMGLSAVRICSVNAAEGKITVEGADLADGTPVYDIKPYVPYADSIPDANGGFTDSIGWKKLEVCIPDGIRNEMGEDAGALIEVLELDPRPQYQEDPDKVYGLTFAGRNIKFRVSEGKLTVLSCG